jgi:glc operon protein GlcG
MEEGQDMYTTTAWKLTRAGAMMVLESAVTAAEKIGRPVSIAVVDEGGHLLAFTRTDDAELYGVPIAIAKARGAALTRFPTGKKSPTGNERSDHHALAITLAAGPDSFVSMPGGVPVKVSGRIVGAVGISGAGHKDAEIAEIAAVVLEKLPDSGNAVETK